MLEAIQNTALKIQGPDATTPSPNALQLIPTASTATAETSDGKQQQSTQTASSHKTDKQGLQDLVDGIQKDMEAINNTGLQFSVHEKTGKIVVEIVDKTTHKTIREIPPKAIQHLADRMDEMVGMLFDKKA